LYKEKLYLKVIFNIVTFFWKSSFETTVALSILIVYKHN